MNNYNQYYDFVNKLDKQSSTMNKKFDFDSEPYRAFIRGNTFTNLYDQYKNYKPKELNPSNEKEYLLLLVQIYGFAAHDLGLYLDVNPRDSKALRLRANYINMYNQAVAEYESKYGPLSLDSDMSSANEWIWDDNNWPWEVQR